MQIGHGHDLGDITLNFLHNSDRRALGGDEAEQGIHIESWYHLLHKGVVVTLQFFVTQGCNHLHFASLHVRHHRQERIHHHVQATAQQLTMGLCTAFVGDVGDLKTGGFFQQLGAQVGGAARSRCAVAQLVGIFLGISNHLGQGIKRGIGLGNDGELQIGHQSNGLDVLDRVVGQGFVQRGIDREGRVDHADGVAVRAGLGHIVHANDRACASFVVNDHGLPPDLLQLHADQAPQSVGGTAGRERHDHFDR